MEYEWFVLIVKELFLVLFGIPCDDFGSFFYENLEQKMIFKKNKTKEVWSQKMFFWYFGFDSMKGGSKTREGKT